jgi:hypothetical protein
MNTETARLANVTWILIPDEQVRVLRAAWVIRDGSPVTASDNEKQPVPLLDWPADLFKDEICH